MVRDQRKMCVSVPGGIPEELKVMDDRDIFISLGKEGFVVL